MHGTAPKGGEHGNVRPTIGRGEGGSLQLAADNECLLRCALRFVHTGTNAREPKPDEEELCPQSLSGSLRYAKLLPEPPQRAVASFRRQAETLDEKRMLRLAS